MKKTFRVKDDQFLAWEKATQKAVEQAVGFAEKSPFPDPRSLLEGLYK